MVTGRRPRRSNRRSNRRSKSLSKTRKNSVLKIDTLSKIGALERLLHNGSLTVVFVYADWCGACTRFKRDIWGPMSRRPALHNRVAVREDLIKNTSLAGTTYKYLPTIMMVNEKGKPEVMQGEEGQTNAIPTPKSPEDMSKIMNAKVMAPAAAEAEEEPMSQPMSMMPNKPKSMIPEGDLFKPGAKTMVYTPLDQDRIENIVPAPPQRGGALFQLLKEANAGTLPSALTAAYQRSLA